MSNDQPQDVADVIAGLDSPTPNEVYHETREYDARYLAAAAAASAASGGGGGGGSQPLETATFSFTAAEVKASTNTPIEIIPAPGADKLLVPVHGTVAYTFVTTPYSNGGIDFAYEGQQTGSLYATAGVLDAAVDRVLPIPAASPATAQNRDAVVDKAVMFATTLVLQGPILTTSLASGGAGYAPGDTGTVDDGPLSGTGGTYEVLTVDGAGAVLTYAVTNPGDDYIGGSINATFVNGGAQPGIGDAAAIYIDTVDGDLAGEPGDGTLSGVFYYLTMDV